MVSIERSDAVSRPGRLEGYARIGLVHGPTPLEYLANLSAQLGTSVYVKRDDCTGLATGGNKGRKLEFVLAEALAAGVDTIITVGGLQSNHARQTAAACARLGLRCVLVLKDSDVARRAGRNQGGNVLLDQLLGADVRVVDACADAQQCMEQVAAEERRCGHRPYIVPLGASTALGTLGYVVCASEILAQMACRCERPTHVVVAAGSGGTQAGLVAGFAALGASDIEVLGVDIDAFHSRTLRRVIDLTGRCCELLGIPKVSDASCHVIDGFAGEAYGEPTAAGNSAIERLARTEGLLLDPVYTGKAMAALIDMTERRTLPESARVVFVHTGGLPLLFAYRESFAPGE